MSNQQIETFFAERLGKAEPLECKKQFLHSFGSNAGGKKQFLHSRKY